jgi:hypothetical protein
MERLIFTSNYCQLLIQAFTRGKEEAICGNITWLNPAELKT